MTAALIGLLACAAAASTFLNGVLVAEGLSKSQVAAQSINASSSLRRAAAVAPWDWVSRRALGRRRSGPAGHRHSRGGLRRGGRRTRDTPARWGLARRWCVAGAGSPRARAPPSRCAPWLRRRRHRANARRGQIPPAAPDASAAHRLRQIPSAAPDPIGCTSAAPDPIGCTSAAPELTKISYSPLATIH